MKSKNQQYWISDQYLDRLMPMRDKEQKTPLAESSSVYEESRKVSERDEANMVGGDLNSFFDGLQKKIDELQSMNRRLRSTIDRLESGKNEAIRRADRLQNINTGLEMRLRSLSKSGGGPAGQVQPLEIPLLVLDHGARVIQFTSQLKDHVPIDEDVIGLPVDGLDLGFDTSILVEGVRNVLERGMPMTRELRIGEDHWYVLFLMPADSADPERREVVAEFIEVTTPRNVRTKLRQVTNYAERIFDSFHDPLVILDSELHIRDANAAFLEAFDYERTDVVDRCILEIDEGRWDHAALRELLGMVMEKDIVLEGYEYEFPTPRSESRVFTVEASRLEDVDLILLSLREITTRKAAVEELREREHTLALLNETLEQRVEERTEQVRLLMRALTLAEQEERRRISLVLHDDLQQRLYGLGMILDLLRQADRQEQSERLMGEADDILNEATNLTRTLSTELSPPIGKLVDVEETFGWLKNRKKELHDLDVDVDVRGEIEITSQSLLDLIYQILRELLFNVVKHAGVDQARLIAWQEDGNVIVCVEDDGCGFDVSQLDNVDNPHSSFGLESIRHRLQIVNGRLLIKSDPGKGTRITIVVPIDID